MYMDLLKLLYIVGLPSCNEPGFTDARQEVANCSASVGNEEWMHAVMKVTCYSLLSVTARDMLRCTAASD
jgi:hypothetical protein